MTMTTEEAVTALQASCLPCELAAAREEMSVPDMEDTQKWEGVLTYEGQNTGDGRLIQPNALSWDTLPIPLRWVQSDVGGHDGAVVVGRINEIERRDDGAIYAFGDFDLGSEAGREAARQVERGLTPGVSVDLDTVSFEVRVASEASEFMNEEIELAAEEPDEDGRVKVAAQGPDDELMITTGARIRAATLVAIPAFEPSRIALAASVVDANGRWHSPLNGEFINMPGFLLAAAIARLSESQMEHPNLPELESAAEAMDVAIAAGDVDALGKAEKAFLDLKNSHDFPEQLFEDPDLQLGLESVAKVLDDGSFGDEDDGFPAGQNPNVTYPPNDIMEEFLIEKGYERDVVDDLTDEELRADFENEGGLDDANSTPSEEDIARIREAEARVEDKIAEGKAREAEVISRALEAEDAGTADEVDIAVIDAAVSGDEDALAEAIAEWERLGGFSANSGEFNWVEDTGTGHLPQYIKRIAKHLKKKGMTEGHAIATAVNAVKKMCATGDINFPGKQQVNVGSQAEACEAVAEWEAKKAQAKADAAEVIVYSDALRAAITPEGSIEVSEKLFLEAMEEGRVVKVGLRDDGAILFDLKEEFRDVSTTERKRLADEGEALPDGSFPIANCGDLKNAIQAIGRAKDPAAARAHIKKRAGELDCDVELPESITAAAFPLQPPSAWFADPGLDGPTPLKVTPDGRVYGHLAVWGTCHTAFPGQCVTPPTSPSNYSYFRTGSVYTAEGTEQNTGVITMDTLHAGKSLSAVSTLAHYEHTGRAIADVNAGEDAYGIWVAGALRPGATDDQVRALRGAPLSGDWRKIGSSGLELVAALAVNVPGFPIPRPQGLAAGGAMQALVAAGMLAPTPPTRAARRNQRKSLSEEDYAYLKRLADRERALVEAETAQMAREVLASDLASSIGF